MITNIPHRAGLLRGAFLCLLLLAASPAAAQWKHTVAGLKLGVSVASFQGQDATDRQARLLLGGGAFLTYQLAPNVALQPEILLARKGGDMDSGLSTEAGTAVDHRTRFNLGYVEIPLLLKAMPAMEGRMRPNVFAGPALDVKLYGDAGAEDLGKRLKRTDWGFVTGAGLDVRIGTRHVMLDGRYTFGLTNIFDLAGNPQVRNGAFSFHVGIGM